MGGSRRAIPAALAFLVLAVSPVKADECSSSEAADVEKFISDYESALETSCASDGCSSDCVSVMTELAADLPDCEYSDGINYYAVTSSSIDLCESDTIDDDEATDSESASMGDSDTALDCTSDESAYIADHLDASSDDYDAACGSDDCSDDCLDILDELTTELPDCVDTDGVNYYEAALSMTDYCLALIEDDGSSGSVDGGSRLNNTRNSSSTSETKPPNATTTKPVPTSLNSTNSRSKSGSSSDESESDSASDESASRAASKKRNKTSSSADSDSGNDSGSNGAEGLGSRYGIGAAMLAIIMLFV